MKKNGLASVSDLLAPHGRRVEGDLKRWLVEPGTPAELAEAMSYCVLGGGKRLRPALVFLAAGAVPGPVDADMTARSAVAVELVHCYSLVHDDLPAMDDDTLRRGLPTAHKKFGEAMAILAGDALLTRAFCVLAEGGGGLVGPLTLELARACGPAGMIAGQVADMKLCRVPAGIEGLDYIHLRKTAAMIRAAARMGALCGRADEAQLAAMGRFGEALGLAFQLFDDMLDATGDARTLGKTPGKDAHHGKRTHVAEIGLEKAQALGEELTRRATAELEPFGDKARDLRDLAYLLAQRTS